MFNCHLGTKKKQKMVGEGKLVYSDMSASCSWRLGNMNVFISSFYFSFLILVCLIHFIKNGVVQAGYRITECSRLEGTLKGCFVQPPAVSRDIKS